MVMGEQGRMEKIYHMIILPAENINGWWWWWWWWMKEEMSQ